MSSLIRDSLRGKSTQELLDILTFNQDDYTAEAVLIIKEILIARGVSEDQISECDAKFRLIIQNTQPAERKQTRITKSTRITNWIYRIAALFLLAFISRTIRTAIVTNTKHESIWTDAYVSKLKTGLASSLDTTFDRDDAESMSACIVDKFEHNYYSNFTTINTDSVESLTQQYAKGCASIIHPKIKWSVKFINIARQKINNADWFQKVSNRYKEPLCDCIISKLENIYINGVPDSISQENSDLAVVYCAKKVKK